MKTKNVGMKSVNIAPSWTGILPVMLALLDCKKREARETAHAELKRMAHLADLYVKSTGGR